LRGESQSHTLSSSAFDGIRSRVIDQNIRCSGVRTFPEISKKTVSRKVLRAVRFFEKHLFQKQAPGAPVPILVQGVITPLHLADDCSGLQPSF
jgi:hypothetical protein